MILKYNTVLQLVATNSQIETLLETRPKRIKLKWSTSLIKDLETIRLLNFDCDIAIDANESLTKPSFLQLANVNTSDIIYIEEPFKILEDLNDIDMSIFLELPSMKRHFL